LNAGTQVSSIVAGSTFTLAITNGGVLGFGNNSEGQLGVFGTSPGVSPWLVPNLIEGSGVLQVSGGGFHSCAIVGNQVYCTGSNSFGQLGRSDITAGMGNRPMTFGPITAPWN
jgi:alpha-tubulin suppressor-like RCC1 family protein